MAKFCSRCGMRVEDPAALECPSCQAPLSTEPPGDPQPGPPAAEPQAGGDIVCTVCNRPFPAEQLLTYQNSRVCPDCKPAFFQRLREGVGVGGSPFQQGAPIPFEAAPGVGSFFSTIKAMIVSPLQTMRGQRTGEGLEAALVFWAVIQIPVQFLSQLSSWAMRNIMPFKPQPSPLPDNAPPALRQLMEMLEPFQNPSLAMGLGIAAAAVIFGVIGLFVMAGMTHGFLRLFGGGSQGFKATLKAFCYSVAPAVFVLIPCCGPIVGGMWSFVLNILLVGPAHREGVGRGVGAYFCALLVFCLCLCGIYMVGGAAFFASMVGGGR